MILNNTANQYIITSSLVSVTDGSRLTSSATVRVCKNGTWADGAGTLSLVETDQWKYIPTQSETNCTQLAVVIDHASAVKPEVFQCRTMASPVGNLDNTTVSDIQDGLSSQSTSDEILSELGDLTATVDQDSIDQIAEGVAESVGDQIGSDPTFVDEAHTFRFEAPDQMTADNVIREVVGFDANIAMDFDTPIPEDSSLFSGSLVSVSPSSGLTVGTPTTKSNKRGVNIPVVASSPGVYTVVILGTSIDSQAYPRRGIVTIESETGT